MGRDSRGRQEVTGAVASGTDMEDLDMEAGDVGAEERLTLTVAEAAKLLGISRGTAYECVRTGQLPSVSFGRRVLIPRRRLEAMLDQDREVA